MAGLLPSWLGRKIVGYIRPHVIQLWDAHPILSTVLTGSLVTLIIYLIIWRKKSRKENLKGVVQRKKEDQRKQFEELRSKFKLDKEAQMILSLDWETLIDRLQKRQLTSSQVLAAFIAKALEVTAKCKAVTEFNPKAIEIAKKLDAMPKVKGPLHGVPFCVKDDTDIEGMDSTLGMAKNCYKPKTESAALVQALEKLGGIPFVKTNVPQTLLSFGSDNPIFGMTTSSHNDKLGPGGSSSGTGALVGSFGAFFGTGTDTGGSLRIPAHCNGVTTLKPSSGRISIRGVSASLPYLIGLDATAGIIGRDAKVVTHVTRLVLQNNFQEQFDPQVIPLPWNDQLFSSSSKKKLRIGYFTQLSYFPPIGDTVEAVEKAVNELRAKCHTLVPLTDILDGTGVMRTAANYLSADNLRQLVEMMKGEETAECSKANKLASKCPSRIMKIVSFLMTQKRLLPWFYSKTLSVFVGAGSMTSAALWDNKEEQHKITQKLLKEWTKLNLDCCICPVMPFPALPVNLPGLLPMGTIYTMLWNLVNFPAGVVKFHKESGKNIDNYDDRGDQCLKMSKKGVKESIGSPIGIQVVGLPYREEMVLRVMEELDGIATEKKSFA